MGHITEVNYVNMDMIGQIQDAPIGPSAFSDGGGREATN